MFNADTKQIDIAEKLNNLDNVLILTHEKPDGDALGSVFALLTFYQETGKNASVLLQEQVPDKYKSFLPEAGVVYCDQNTDISAFSIIVSLDCTDIKRLGVSDHIKDILTNHEVINIDHHFDNSMFGVINYIDPGASAAGEILFDLFSLVYSYSISKVCGTYIALAVISDTGGLKFDNTSSAVMKKMGELIDIGVDYVGISKHIFSTRKFSLFMLEADIAVNHVKWFFDRRFAYCYVTDELLNKYSLTIKDIEGLIDSYRSVEGVNVAALVTKRGDIFKISLRSNDKQHHVVEIAHELNGGGHKLAAGCSISADTIDEVEKILLKKVSILLNI